MKSGAGDEPATAHRGAGRVARSLSDDADARRRRRRPALLRRRRRLGTFRFFSGFTGFN